jgi:hypothetical protein
MYMILDTGIYTCILLNCFELVASMHIIRQPSILSERDGDKPG